MQLKYFKFILFLSIIFLYSCENMNEDSYIIANKWETKAQNVLLLKKYIANQVVSVFPYDVDSVTFKKYRIGRRIVLNSETMEIIR